MLTFDNKAFRGVASFAPYDFVEIVTNARTYGGGGIYGLYSTVAADNAYAPYVFVHEFGHHFAALADEYYTSPVAYLPAPRATEPWEPNVTALLDPAALKWKDLVAAGHAAADAVAERGVRAAVTRRAVRNARRSAKQSRPEAEMEALFSEERADGRRGSFASEKYAGQGRRVRRRPLRGARATTARQVDCIMFTRSEEFCAVCRRAISRVIDSHVR